MTKINYLSCYWAKRIYFNKKISIKNIITIQVLNGCEHRSHCRGVNDFLKFTGVPCTKSLIPIRFLCKNSWRLLLLKEQHPIIHSRISIHFFTSKFKTTLLSCWPFHDYILLKIWMLCNRICLDQNDQIWKNLRNHFNVKIFEKKTNCIETFYRKPKKSFD